MAGALFLRCGVGEDVTIVKGVRSVGGGGGGGSSVDSDDGLSSGSERDLCLRRGCGPALFCHDDSSSPLSEEEVVESSSVEDN